MSHYCPRRDDTARWMAGQSGLLFIDPELRVGQTPLEDEWRVDGRRWDGVTGGLPNCTYCGSLRPDDFVRSLSTAVVHGTDKRYKAYVILPNPSAGRDRVVSTSYDEDAPARWGGSGWLREDELPKELRDEQRGDRKPRWYQVGPEGPTAQAKFYFQHLAHPCPERSALYDWYMSHPGVFYSGAPLGLHLEHIARHPETMTDDERAGLSAFRLRNPGVKAP